MLFIKLSPPLLLPTQYNGYKSTKCIILKEKNWTIEGPIDTFWLDKALPWTNLIIQNVSLGIG